MNEDFAKWIRTGLPFVTLKSRSHSTAKLPRARDNPRRSRAKRRARLSSAMRHAADALLTGIGTVLADDPLLTDRSGEPRRRKTSPRDPRFAAATSAEIDAS